jgi:hypothetical protein
VGKENGVKELNKIWESGEVFWRRWAIVNNKLGENINE